MQSVPQQYRRARWAVAALFWLNGATMATMLPRYPLIRDNLGLSNTFFGLAIALGPFGGLITGFFTARTMRRFSSGTVAVWAQIAQILCSLVVLNAPAPIWFAVGLFLMSATDVYTDIAMNAHGLRVQKHYPRSINNTFHGFWSVGAFFGGLLGSLFAGINLPLWQHSLVAAAIMLVVNITLRPFLLKGPDTEIAEETADDTPRSRSPIPRTLWPHLLALGLMGAFAAEIEDSGFNWAAIYLHDALGAAPALAGMGLAALVGAQTIGRFTGDALTDRLGYRSTARLGCGVATVAMLAALAFQSIPLTLLGFALAGWGVATVVPAVYVAGDNIPGLPHGAGLSVVNWLLRLSFIVFPPLVGRVGDLVGLRTALLLMPISTLMVVLFSGHLAGGRPRHEASREAVLAQASADRN
ncbi:MAG TPA: MFS transporter [Candidatus Luteococcus avicola]|nr:MFS transporter [Candidatus Luteococcus avicola]